MFNPLRKYKLLFAMVAGVFVLSFIIIPSSCAQNGISTTPTPDQKFSTPDLIQQAFAMGEITDEQRLLYLAYALGDYEKLPTQFHSKLPWSGTMIGRELYETVKSKEKVCKFSPFIQRELRRVLKIEGAICD